jgi:tetratricopeptide (TPR) repeat protein/tRNA A-37 threonylcarbamoyl transferase component Bud32
VTPERWREAQRLFHEAREKPAAERSAFVAAASEGDAELAAEVASLLAADADSGGFLETPAAPPEPLRTRVGPWQILQEIGHGGMGTVYLGERADGPFRKRVAVKVVRRGMDTEAVLKRFRQERQILAGLEHPNIARLLDGGNTDDGLPYLVMEYVEGEPLTAWCARRGLDVPERLALFRTICATVQFAHQNLVVHRDLKPGNITVTADGTPKLLDFGVAKLLNADLAGTTRDLTVAGGGAFTPEYASPEQLRGERITTASDVWSLGVLLYELLAGVRPFGAAGAPPGEVAKAVLETEPEKPSAAAARAGDERTRRRLEGDLDTIVLKALRKEPERRYASAEQFSEDLRRHLEGAPVKARRDTFTYRTGKFLARHRAAAAAAALVLVALVGGILATARQARIARAERARADRRLEDVRKLAGSFLFEFHDAIVTLPGSTPARELVVRRALEYLGTIAKEVSGDPVAERDLADAYERLAEVQGGGSGPNLGDTKGAIASERASLAIREALAARPGAGPREKESLAVAHGMLSKLFLKSWQLEAARDEGEKAVALLEEIGRTDFSARILLRLGGTYHNLGLLEDLLGRRPAALATLAKSTAAYGAAASGKPGDVDARRGLALATFERASVYHHSGDLPAARAEGEKAVAIYESLLANDPGNARLKMDLAMALHDVGEFASGLANVPEALVHHRRALALVEEIAAADPRDARAQVAIAYCANGLGESLARSGDTAGAVALHARAARLSETVLANDSANAYARRNRATAFELAGDALSLRARPPAAASALVEARSWYTRALDAWESMGREHKLQGDDATAPVRIQKAIERCGAAPASRGASKNPKSRPTP